MVIDLGRWVTGACWVYWHYKVKGSVYNIYKFIVYIYRFDRIITVIRVYQTDIFIIYWSDISSNVHF